jgi:TonB family protein
MPAGVPSPQPSVAERTSCWANTNAAPIAADLAQTTCNLATADAWRIIHVPYVRSKRALWLAVSLAGAIALRLPPRHAHAQDTTTHDQPAAASTESVTPPKLLQSALPVYPGQAPAPGQDVSVSLIVTVGADGGVEAVEVAQTAGPELDDAAMAAVRKWRFQPARRGERPVSSRIRVPVHFITQEVAASTVDAAVPAEIAAAATSSVTASSPEPAAPERFPAVKPAAASAVPLQPTAAAVAVSQPAAEPAGPPAFEASAHARVHAPSRGTSDFQLEPGKLASVPRENASAMLKLAPGILLTNEGGEGHAEQVFMRGFDAREGQDIEFSAGGVPINQAGNLHGNGYADTHFIIPELVTSLRVQEGPFDPRQGNFAVAGSADYELGLQQRGLTAKQMLGSFGTSRTLLLWGPTGESTGTYTGVELYQTQGFGENRDGRRGSLLTQYEGRSGVHTYRVAATAYLASFHTAGVLREDDYAQHRVGFYDTYDPRQGEDASRYSLSAELDSHHDHMLVRHEIFGIVQPLHLRENFTGFLLDPQEPSQSPHAQRGDLIDLHNDSSTVGARGSVQVSDRAFGQAQRLEVGYFGRGDFVDSTAMRVEAATGHPYHTDTDLSSTLGDLGLYADLNLRANDWLALRGGLRADLFTYDVLNRCAVQSVSHPSRTSPPGDASCLSQQDFGAYREPTQRVSTVGAVQSPRASLVVGPFSGVSGSIGYGRGVRSIDPIYISQDAKTPFASADSIETGLSLDRKLGALEVSARSTLFQTRVDHDLIFSQSAGRNVLGGASTRTGNANTLRATGGFFDLAANLTYVRAVFSDTGLLIPYIPDWVARFDGVLFSDHLLRADQAGGHPVRGSFATGATFVAPRPLPQGERGDSVFTLDLNATVGWSMLELGLSCTNLLDTLYRLGEYNYASDFHSSAFPTLVPVRHFSAGAPRALYVTLAIHLGGER